MRRSAAKTTAAAAEDSKIPAFDVPHTRFIPRPAPPYPMTIQNYVSSAQMKRADKPDEKFDTVLIADALHGTCSNKGFSCVTVKQMTRKMCCMDHAATRMASERQIKSTARLNYEYRGSAPLVCCHVFSTGSIIICGARSYMNAIAGLYRMIETLHRKYGWILQLTQVPSTSNAVASTALGYPLDLVRIRADMGMRSQYEPSDYTGLQYFPSMPEYVTNADDADSRRSPCVILFRTGSVTVVGAKSLEHAVSVVSSVDWTKYIPEGYESGTARVY